MTTPQEYDYALQAEKEVVDRLFGQKSLKDKISLRDYEINKIAKNLFLINFTQKERDEILFSKYDSNHIIELYRNKAEKLYEATNSLEDAAKFIKILYTILPKSIKEIINAL